jgi:hypothetical protein
MAKIGERYSCTEIGEIWTVVSDSQRPCSGCKLYTRVGLPAPDGKAGVVYGDGTEEMLHKGIAKVSLPDPRPPFIPTVDDWDLLPDADNVDPTVPRAYLKG